MIKAAAVKTLLGNIYIGRDHAQCFNKMYYISKKEHINAIQGFVDTAGNFLDRTTAGKLAWECKQIKDNPNGSIILSEEIWSSGGNCYWDETTESYQYNIKGG